jgi:hypothetical protein
VGGLGAFPWVRRTLTRGLTLPVVLRRRHYSTEKIKKGQFETGKLGGAKATMSELWNAALVACSHRSQASQTDAQEPALESPTIVPSQAASS